MPVGSRLSASAGRSARAAGGSSSISKASGNGRVAGQPEPADLAVAAQRPGRAYGVVVEAAGHRDPAHRLRRVRRRPSSPPGASRTASTCAASREHGPQRLAQLALGDLPVFLLGLPGGVRGLVEHDRGGRVEHAGGGQLLGDGGAAEQLGVERGAGGVDPGVQPVEAAGGPAQIEADGDERDERSR